MIKNNFRILKKQYAYLQTILKTPVKFHSITSSEEDRNLEVGGSTIEQHIFHLHNPWMLHFGWGRYIRAGSWDYGTYHIGDQRRLRRACASCSLARAFAVRSHKVWKVDKGSHKKIRHLSPLDGCTCAFEEWVYRGQKVPKLLSGLITGSNHTATYYHNDPKFSDRLGLGKQCKRSTLIPPASFGCISVW